MTADPLVSATLAARRAIRDLNPDLLAWSSQQWDLWIEIQRSAPPICNQPRMLAVVALTCIDDLRLHLGLMQLLGLPDLHCRVVLSLPTEDLARLVRSQARREEWHGLAQIVAEAECAELLSRLPRGAALAVFPFPSLLPADASVVLAALYGAPTKPRSAGSALHHAFLGHARDYAVWRNELGPIEERAARAIRGILAHEPAGPAFHADIPAPPRAHGSAEVAAEIAIAKDRIEISEFGDGQELTMTAVRGSEVGPVIFRKSGEILQSKLDMSFRMPGRLLTTEPQEIRVEIGNSSGEIAGADILFHAPPARFQPWMVSAFLNRGGAGNSVIHAFAQAIGCRLAYAEDEPEVLSEIPVVWGVLRGSDRILAQAKAQSLYFFYIDHAYFNRGHGKTYRITRNGYEAGAVRDCPPDRLLELEVETLPWRRGGREIIVCPPTDYFMQAHGCTDWLDTTLATLREVTDRPVVVRAKPQPGQQAVPLPHALESAHALVTHSSNVAIEAACLGTPVFVAPASAAAPVGRTDLSKIELPFYPDREPWLAHLAYNQFSFEEIEDGRAWSMLLELEDRPFV